MDQVNIYQILGSVIFKTSPQYQSCVFFQRTKGTQDDKTFTITTLTNQPTYHHPRPWRRTRARRPTVPRPTPTTRASTVRLCCCAPIASATRY